MTVSLKDLTEYKRKHERITIILLIVTALGTWGLTSYLKGQTITQLKKNKAELETELQTAHAVHSKDTETINKLKTSLNAIKTELKKRDSSRSLSSSKKNKPKGGRRTRRRR